MMKTDYICQFKTNPDKKALKIIRKMQKKLKQLSLILTLLSPVIHIIHPTCALASRCIVIDKAKKELVTIVNGEKKHDFQVSIGLDTFSDKRRVFDCATPEGAYVVTHKNGSNEFQKFIGFSYPNMADAWYARHKGVISEHQYQKCLSAHKKGKLLPSDTELGNSLGIHGGGISRCKDGSSACNWTKGCVAMEDIDIEKFYEFAKKGDDVVIFHSGKDLFQMLMPFANLKEKDYETCPGKLDCYGIVRLKTKQGIADIKLKEGIDFSRSIEISLFKNEYQQEPSVKIFDEEANGSFDEWDKITVFNDANGEHEIKDSQEGQEQYDGIKKDIVNALTSCDILQQKIE